MDVTRVMLPIRRCPFGEITAISYYRGYLPLKRLSGNDDRYDVKTFDNNGIVVYSWMLNETGRKFGDEFDIYWITRLHNTVDETISVQQVVERMHEMGAVAVFDSDDDLMGDYRQFDGSKAFVETIKVMDVVTASTPYLADRMREYVDTKPIVLPNCIDVDWFSRVSMRSERKSDKLTLGFIGTTTHEEDWIYAGEALRKIANKYENVQVYSAGYMPDYLSAIPNIKKLPPVPYNNYPSLMRQFDIVCCALDEEDKFNKSKSAVKFLEAGAAGRMVNGRIGGAVSVCTDMVTYNRVVRHHVNGVLVANKTNEWYNALARLVEDREYREKLSWRAHSWVKNNRDIAKHYNEWATVLRKAELLRHE